MDTHTGFGSPIICSCAPSANLISSTGDDDCAARGKASSATRTPFHDLMICQSERARARAQAGACGSDTGSPGMPGGCGRLTGQMR